MSKVVIKNKCHSKLDLESHRTVRSKYVGQALPALLSGFTLIEVLVVVLIVAVLTAVAMPMYKRAVLKSRFSTVMPMAKSVANAQEIYYLGNGYYAQNDQKDLLDISNTDVENTTITLSDTEGYDYVLAQRTDVPELHYVMYQRNSENYPGEIHCEAKNDDANAQYVCNSFGGTQDKIGRASCRERV